MNSNGKHLLDTLRNRFAANMHRHRGVSFDNIEKLLTSDNMDSLSMMEASGGEPDVFLLPDRSLVYIDFSKETPAGRRSLCYDQEARVSRKKFPPFSSAAEEAIKMGTELMDAILYRQIQEIEPIDLKTSSWLLSPDPIRKLGGAIFGDNRYDTVFIYHNGADSYYESRGFRTVLRL